LKGVDVDRDVRKIDIENFDENDDFELHEVNRNVYEWLEAMFDSDSDNYVKNYDCSSIQDKMGDYDCSRIQDKMGDYDCSRIQDKMG
jgi:hypothetical protein